MMSTVDREPNPLTHTLVSVRDLVAFVSEEADIFVDFSGVVTLLDREDRYARTAMSLTPTPTFHTLAALALEPKLFEQRQAIQFLRNAIEGMAGHTMVAALRNLTFERNSGGTGKVAHGRESLGRSVESAIIGAQEIPESFDVELTFWTNPGLAHITSRVRVNVDLVPEESKIGFSVQKDAFVRAQLSAVEQLRTTIVEQLVAATKSGARVFHGRP